MTEQGYRSVFAILGLVAGLVLMWLLGLGGAILGAVFGAGGTVAGAMIGERIARRAGRGERGQERRGAPESSREDKVSPWRIDRDE